MSSRIFTVPNFAIWQFRGIVTQTAGGGGTLTMEIGFEDIGSKFQLQWLQYGPDDYAAGRNISIAVSDVGNVVHYSMFPATSLDNAVLVWPFRDGQTANVLLGKPDPIWIAGDDKIQIFATSLVQNETMTINCRAIIYGSVPTVDISRSAGTAALATTYNKVGG